MKKCIYCAEEIQEDALKCRYCGEYLPEYNQYLEEKSNQEKIENERKEKRLQKDGLMNPGRILLML